MEAFGNQYPEVITSEPEILQAMLTLPKDPSPKIIKKKRPVQAPDPAVLKPQQLIAVETMQDYVQDMLENRLLLIDGFAGVGKSFSINWFIEWYLTTIKRPVVVVTPTNKSVKVIRQMAEFTGMIEYMTIHRLLGLRERVDGYGRKIYEPDPRIPNKVGDFELIIVDETSMIKEDLQRKLETCAFNGKKIIYVGDSVQIPPVEEEIALLFEHRYQDKMDIGVIQMDQVIRQKAGNPIIDLATAIRMDIHRAYMQQEVNSGMTEQGGLLIMNHASYFSEIHQIMEVYFTSEHFSKNPDFFKMLAWRNDTVDDLNRQIRKRIYKDQPITKLMAGEKMLADSPIIMDNVIIFSTSAEFEVVSWDVQQEEEYKYYLVKVKAEDDFGREYEQYIRVIHEDSEKKFKEDLDKLKAHAQSFKQGSFQASEAWSSYYSFLQYFADVNYNYALTVHKSQGSTYENCMVFADDIMASPRVYERNRINYVGVTRARTNLFYVV